MFVINFSRHGCHACAIYETTFLRVAAELGSNDLIFEIEDADADRHAMVSRLPLTQIRNNEQQVLREIGGRLNEEELKRFIRGEQL